MPGGLSKLLLGPDTALDNLTFIATSDNSKANLLSALIEGAAERGARRVRGYSSRRRINDRFSLRMQPAASTRRKHSTASGSDNSFSRYCS
jgi:hypothetical protein